MSNLNGRVTRLEEQQEQVNQAPAWDPLDPLRRLVGDCLTHYPGARPGCMALKDSVCYSWAIDWPYVWQFCAWLRRHNLADVPERFDTKEEARAAIDQLHQALLMLRAELEQRKKQDGLSN